MVGTVRMGCVVVIAVVGGGRKRNGRENLGERRSREREMREGIEERKKRKK